MRTRNPTESTRFKTLLATQAVQLWFFLTLEQTQTWRNREAQQYQPRRRQATSMIFQSILAMSKLGIWHMQ
jgi:hypothetical protein